MGFKSNSLRGKEGINNLETEQSKDQKILE